jgi:hypothetical protein
MVPLQGLAAAHGKCVDYIEPAPVYVNPPCFLMATPLISPKNRETYQEVHLCKLEFVVAHTRLYQTLSMMLQECVSLEKGVARAQNHMWIHVAEDASHT